MGTERWSRRAIIWLVYVQIRTNNTNINDFFHAVWLTHSIHLSLELLFSFPPRRCQVSVFCRIYLHKEKKTCNVLRNHFVYNFSQVVLLTEGLSSRAALLLEFNASLEAFTDKLR